jgi:predicted dehydrogenase
MSTDHIRLGVVGAGAIARAEHLPRFRGIEGVEIVGVANSSAESTRAVASAERIATAYGDWHELVDDRSIDAVLVATRPDLHAPVTVAALEAGKHVLVEARMADTLAAARRMVAAAAARPERVAALVPSSFSLWADRTIIRRLGDGSIGALRHARVAWDASGSVAPSEWWRWSRRVSGVNVMALGIVLEAMIRWLGPVTAVQTSARILMPRKPGPGGDIDADVADHILVTAAFGEVTAALEMSIATVHHGSRIELIGDRGSLELDVAAGTLTLAERGGGRTDVPIAPEDRLGWTAELDFVSAIRGGPSGTLTDFSTGLTYMAAVAASDTSGRTGRRVAVSPDGPG